MHTSERPETGAMQFGNDWPGVFIRGDQAIGFTVSLEDALERINNPRKRITGAQRINDQEGLKEIIDLLQKCNVNNKNYSSEKCQKLKNIDKCIL